MKRTDRIIGKYSTVDWSGRLHVDVDRLLRDPKVRETLARLDARIHIAYGKEPQEKET